MATTEIIPKPVVPPPDINISELARQHGVARRTIKRWQQKGWAPPAAATIKIVEQSQQVPSSAHPPGRHYILGGICGLICGGLLAVGLAVNATHYWSLARDGAYLFAGLGALIDLAA